MIGVQDRHHAEVRLALPEQHHLLEQRIARDRRFDIHRWHFLAVGEDDDLLQPPGDVDVPLRVDARGVAGVEPAIRPDHRLGRFRVVPIAQHDVRPLDQQRIVLADLDLNPRESPADTRRNVVFRTIGGHGRAGFGEPVTLQHPQAQPDKHARNVGRQSRTAGKCGPQTAAEPRQDFSCDQGVQHRPHQERRFPRPAPLLMLEARIAHAHRQLEQLLPHRRPLSELPADRPIDALVDAWHRYQQRRPYGLQVFRELRDRARIRRRRPGHDAEVVAAGALQGMRQRQKREEHVFRRRGEHGGEARRGIGQDVVMREHHALGTPGRARSVDNGCERMRIARHVARLSARVRQPFVERFQARLSRIRDRRDREDARQPAELVLDFRQRLPLLRTLDHQHLAASIADDVGGVVRAVLGIERHHHQPQAERRLIVDHPLRTVAQHHCDAVAGPEPVLFQSGLPARRLVIHLHPGVIAPVAVRLVEMPIRDQIRSALYALPEQAVERDRGLDRNHMSRCITGCHDRSSFQSRNRSAYNPAPGVTA